MPRLPRKRSCTGIYHIMLRGINKQSIFQEDQDRIKFLSVLDRYKQVSNYQLYGYCLMTNHIHLLLKENDEPVSDVMKRISSSYVFWYNQKYNRSGHLFQERYKSETVDNDSYLLTVLRYIHQNPVKANLCKGIQEHRWSSYKDYLGRSTLTDTAYVKGLFSENDEQAAKQYCEFMLQEQNDNCLDEEEKMNITDETLEECFKQYGLKSSREIMCLEKSKQMEILRKIKLLGGVSARQLSRVSGISRSFIQKI